MNRSALILLTLLSVSAYAEEQMPVHPEGTEKKSVLQRAKEGTKKVWDKLWAEDKSFTCKKEWHYPDVSDSGTFNVMYFPPECKDLDPHLQIEPTEEELKQEPIELPVKEDPEGIEEEEPKVSKVVKF